MAKILGAQIPSEIKNLAINGNFDFWQRVEANAQTVNASTTNAAYAADMWAYEWGGTTNKNFTIQQSATVPTQAQSGYFSQFSNAIIINAGISSPAAGDYIIPVEYRMEGLDYQKIHNKTVTFGFWVYATVPGTYNFALENGALTRTYCTTFTVSAALTWQFVSITIALDVSTANWVFANQVALKIFIGGYAGTTYQTSTTNAWQSGNFFVASGSTNWQATTGAVFQIAQFSIVEGPLGFSATGFQRAGKDIQQELALCQRYYEKSYDQGVVPGSNSASGAHAMPVGSQSLANFRSAVYYKVNKRSDATSISVWDLVGNANTFSWFNAANAQTNNTTGSINTFSSGHNAFHYNAASPSSSTYCSIATHWAAEDGL